VTTVAVPLLLMAAGLFASLAIRHADRTVVARRIDGSEVRVPVRRGPLPALPGIDWRWWPLAGAVGGWLMGGGIAAALGAVVTVVGSGMLRRRGAAKIAAALDEELADAVHSFAAGMRAGLSVPQAIAYAAREGEPPLADGLARIVDRVELGGELEDALEDWADGIGTDDARLVVGVLALHRRSGGDLPRVLDQVAATLRERSSAAREVRALTAQARLSGAILGLLPIAFFGFLWLTSRANIEGAFASPIGVGAVVVGLVLEGVAFLWIRSLLEVG
jgi:Flp pilus assembly protein TadB